jgi:hypothetical protein
MYLPRSCRESYAGNPYIRNKRKPNSRSSVVLYKGNKEESLKDSWKEWKKKGKNLQEDRLLKNRRKTSYSSLFFK